jgi:septal ring factor EnvC (AmiA/AmiB activator)
LNSVHKEYSENHRKTTSTHEEKILTIHRDLTGQLSSEREKSANTIATLQTELKNTHSNKETEVNRLTEERKKYESVMGNELGDHKKRMEELKRELAALQDKVRTTEEEKNRTNESLNKQIMDLTKQLQEGKSQKDVHVLEIHKEYSEKMAKVQKDHDTNVNGEKERNAKLIAQLETNIKFKETELLKLVDERKNFQGSHDNDLDAFKRQIEALNKDISTLTDKMHQMESNLRAEIKGLQTQVTERDITIRTSTTETIELKKKHEIQIKGMLDERDELKKQLAITGTKLDDEVKYEGQELSRLTRELDAYKEKYRLLVIEYEQYKLAQQKTIIELRDEIAKLKKLVEEKDAILKQTLDKYTKLQTDWNLKDTQIKVYSREIHVFTEGYCFNRIYQGSKPKVAITEEQEMQLLLQFMSWGKGQPLTIKEFIDFFSQIEFMQGVSLSLLQRLFGKGTQKFIGYIQTLAAFKDLYLLKESFMSLSNGVTISRQGLKKVFEEGHLGFVDHPKTFDALCSNIDRSYDDQISDKEFLGLGLVLCVFRLLFVVTDDNQNNMLIFTEIRDMLNKFAADPDLHTKLQTNLDLFVRKEDRDRIGRENKDKYELPYDRFVGLMLHSVANEE